MKRIVGILMVLITLGVVVRAGLIRYHSRQSARVGKLVVTTSFYPLYFFASQITGDLADVVAITPAGVEPHDYELTPGDVQRIETSDIVFVNGGVEPWSDKIVSKNMVFVAKDMIINNDPHVWLDPLLAIRMVHTMSEIIVAADPSHSDIYNTRTAELVTKLDRLDSEFRQALKGCSQHTLVTAHKAWGYLASRYGLSQVAIAGLSPEQEPAAKDLAAVVKAVRSNKVQAVFFEALTDPKLANAVATETGAQLLELNPIEGLTSLERQTGDDYFSLQRTNLEHLVTGLPCR